MSKRNALIVAIVVAVVLAALFLWPEPARADFAASARIGGGFGGSHGSFHGSYHGGIAGGHSGGLRGGFRGGRTFGGHDAVRPGSFGHHRGHPKRGLHLGDRYRLKTLRHIDREHGRQSAHKGRHGGRHGGGHDARFLGSVGHGAFPVHGGPVLGERFRRHTVRALLHENHRDRHRVRHGDRHQHDSDRHGKHGSGGRDAGGHDFRFGVFPRRGWEGHRGRRGGKWLNAEAVVLSYDDPDARNVIVREIIIPVPVPAARLPEVAPDSRPALDPRGRVTVVGGDDGIVGDWAEGDVLPLGVPLVTLDPVAYDLPQPPLGEKYARVGNDVMRIDAGSRRITAIVAR